LRFKEVGLDCETGEVDMLFLKKICSFEKKTGQLTDWHSFEEFILRGRKKRRQRFQIITLVNNSMQSNTIDVAVLRGSPLVRYAYGAASAVQYDVSTDLDPLCTYLASKAHVSSSVATLSAFDLALRQGCRILHFSGRSTLVSNEHCLGFETDMGIEFPFPVPAAAVAPVVGFGAEADAARLAAESTVEALRRSQRLAHVKLIVLMASQSATVVPSLLSAGAPSVICVDSRFDISDRAAALFSRALYDALFNGPSIRAAFESAKAHLNRLSLMSAADADLANEARKIVLLPLEVCHGS
jgi:hypothetical protein